MTQHDDYPTHLDPLLGDPRGRAAAQQTIHRAVRALRVEHDLTERAAFLLLVRASAESRSSVQATSARIVADWNTLGGYGKNDG